MFKVAYQIGFEGGVVVGKVMDEFFLVVDSLQACR
jgi:hypothetical protein